MGILQFYSYHLLLKDVFHVCRLLTECEDGQHDSTSKVRPKHPQCLPGGVCSIGHKLPQIPEYPLKRWFLSLHVVSMTQFKCSLLISLFLLKFLFLQEGSETSWLTAEWVYGERKRCLSASPLNHSRADRLSVIFSTTLQHSFHFSIVGESGDISTILLMVQMYFVVCYHFKGTYLYPKLYVSQSLVDMFALEDAEGTTSASHQEPKDGSNPVSDF